MFDDLIDMISSSLLDPANLPDIYSRIVNELGYTSEEARYFIYQSVKQLNESFFPPITELELVLTEECNLSCSYCFEKGMVQCKKMPIEVARAAVNLLFDYSEGEMDLSIAHFGGEPLMNFPLIRYVTEYAEKKAELSGKKVSFFMTSNGTLLNESRADYIAKHKINVLLSIDGCKSSHDRYRIDKKGRGTFERAMRGMRILKKVQPWVGTKMTVMPENIPWMFEDVVFLHSMGINQFLIGHATGIKWSKEDMESFGKQMRKINHWYKEKNSQDLRINGLDKQYEVSEVFGCRAGRNSISISAYGEVSCCSKVLSLNNRQLLHKLGDVEYGLTHIFNREELVNCLKLKSACKALGIAEDYRGGCFAANYEENDDLFQPSLQNYAFSLQDRSYLP